MCGPRSWAHSGAIQRELPCGWHRRGGFGGGILQNKCDRTKASRETDGRLMPPKAASLPGPILKSRMSYAQTCTGMTISLEELPEISRPLFTADAVRLCMLPRWVPASLALSTDLLRALLITSINKHDSNEEITGTRK